MLERCILGKSTADLTHWLSSIPQLKGYVLAPFPPVLQPTFQPTSLRFRLSQSSRYVGMFEDAECTGEQLLQVESDELLEEFGIVSEVDRKYLLLQLSRVRDRKRAERQRLMGPLLPPTQNRRSKIAKLSNIVKNL